MKKIKIIITCTVIIITMLINLLINQTSLAQTQMQIISDKQTIKKDEEINI